jgi:PAS domain-containing protein
LVARICDAGFFSKAGPFAGFGLLFSVATVLLFLIDLQTRHWDTIAAAKKDAQSFANILAEHTALTFEDVDRALREAADIRQTSLSAKKADPAAVDAALRQLQRSSSVFVGIGWTDASGELLAHSFTRKPPRSNIGGMPHFIALRDSASDQLVITPPFRSAAGEKWFTGVTRRLNNPDGSFAGVVAAVIDQSHFAQLYRSIDLGKGGTIFLLHRDGLLVAREPEQEDAIGKSLVDGQLLAKYLPTSESGAYETASSVVDGTARIIGYRAVPGLPLVVAVSYARSEALAPWYRRLVTFGLLVVAIVAVILFGTLLLVRKTNALAAKTRALGRTNARFEAALSNMPHGLSMLDANQTLLVANSRYREMYGLAEDLVKPGTPLRRVLRELQATGRIADLDVDRFIQSLSEQGKGILMFADGRTFAITRTAMQGGGWVATHEDITESRHAEVRLIENAAELKRTNERFHAAISNMSQGLCLFSADKRLVISNRRFQEIYGLPDRLVVPGTSLAWIYQFYVDRGDTKNLTTEQTLELMKDKETLDYEPADGRVLHIQRTPTPDGGWVSTHEDITVQKRAEQMVAEKAAELEAMNVRFDAALNNMSQGLCMFDAEQRVVVSNARYGEIYHLGRDQIGPGTSLREILDFRREKGTNFLVTPETYLEGNARAPKEVQELADGRVVEIARQMMPDGGWSPRTRISPNGRAMNSGSRSWRSTICSPGSRTARCFPNGSSRPASGWRVMAPPSPC